MPAQVKVMIVAGEASGDLHGSNLIKAVYEREPGIAFFGVGGPRIKETGSQILVDSAELAVVGISEVLPNIGKIFAALNLLKKKLIEERPSLVVLIDFPDFNLMLAKHAKKAGIPILYYISPQVWAWRRKRVNKIAKLVDRMAVIFPFEVDFYEKAGLDASFVGHPLIDAVKVSGNREDIRRKFGIEEGKRVIGLLPGSRGKEIKSLLPPMLESAEIMAARSLEFRFILPVAHTLDRSLLDAHLALYNVDVTVVEGATYEVMKACDAAFIASGTASLEAAIIGTPMVVVYSASPLTYLIGRIFVMKNIEYFSLPNIIAGRKIIPELLQDDANAGRMVEEMFAILYGKGIYEQMVKDLEEVRDKLGGEGASGRTAELVIEMIKGQVKSGAC